MYLAFRTPQCLEIVYLYLGSLDSRERKRQDSSRHKSSPGVVEYESERGTLGRGSNHGVRLSSLLRPHSSCVLDSSDDAHHSTDATWLPARLCAQGKVQHRFKDFPFMEHSDS